MVKPPLRTKSIGFKVSEEEYAQLETAAQASGRTLGEWCREMILRGGASNAAAHDPALAEIIGVRLLLVNVLGPVAAGEKVTPEKFNQLLDQIGEAKQQLAAKLQQASEKPQREKPIVLIRTTAVNGSSDLFEYLVNLVLNDFTPRRLQITHCALNI